MNNVNRSHLYAGLRQAQEARAFARINRAIVVVAIIIGIAYVAYEIFRTL